MKNVCRVIWLLTIGTLLFALPPAPVKSFSSQIPNPKSQILNLIEADWQLQDETRMREIREPGLVRFVEGELNWGGVNTDNAVSVPKQNAPTLDGRLDESCWQKAAVIAAPNANEPAFRLCHDGQRFYVGVSLPTTAEARFSGDVTAADAAGAVDGVKNGRYAFHTGGDPNPWWQVDLGASSEIAKIVIYNRLDYAPGLHNADNLIILTSDDEQNWTVRHENKGKHFGGVGGGGPLVVNLPQGVKARFVRVQLPGNTPILFHLDEVEVYDASNNNIALRKPAKQSSLSIWSRGGLMGSALFDFGGMKVNLGVNGSMGQRVNGRGGASVPAPSAPTEGLTVNGKPYEQGGVFRADGRTMIEVALPLRVGGGFPGRITLTGDRAFPLMLSGDWMLRMFDDQSLGFGRNRLKVDLQTTERRAHLPVGRRVQNAVGRERTLCRSSEREDSMSSRSATTVQITSDIESSSSEERHSVRSLPERFEPPVELTVETVVFTPQRAERRSVQKSVSEPGATFVEFDIAHEGAAAVFLTARQGAAMVCQTRTFFVHPVRETLERARRLLQDFDGLAETRRPYNVLQNRADELAERERTNGADLAARATLYREARWLAREVAFQNPLLPEKLVFVKRFTQQSYPDVCLNHMPWVSRPGGDICTLSPLRPDGEVRPLLNGKLGPGHVHGMDLWWDANRVVFGYAKKQSHEPPEGWLDRARSYELRRSVEPTHIFEIGTDGNNLRQLTKGEWSDLDPTYLPNGDVAFVSERCGFSLQCNELDKDETSCNLYVMKSDGSKIRRMSVTKDGDYLPHTLDNGLVAYTRWEYHERNWANIQSIWTIRPDGTGADALFKQHLNDPWALEDSRSIPHSQKLISIATGHHTLAAGPVVIINPSVGINNPDGIGIVTPGVVPPEGGMSGKVVPEGGVRGKGGHYMTPWALSDKHFIASYTYGGMTDEKGYALYLIDVYGTRELIYRDPNISCSVPIPLHPRKRPPILPSSVDLRKRTATCVVTNVHEGVEGVKPGTIRYIRISEPLGWPYDNVHGGQRYEPDVKSVMLNWNPVRVIGTVPVETDGSAHFTVPADTELSFQALDKNYMEIVRMRSFISFQPGEVRGCTGCHETRAAAPGKLGNWEIGKSGNTRTQERGNSKQFPNSPISQFPNFPAPLALRRKPSVPVPPSWGGDRALSFLRDVQPVFDKHCVKCHSGLKPAGGLDFWGGLTAKYNRAFETILNAGLVARSNIGDDAKITKPLMFGSHKSEIIKSLGANHHKSVKLSGDDWLRLVTWVDANAPYHGGFICKRTKTQPYDIASDRELLKKIADVHARRCASCHEVNAVTRSDWIDLRDPSRSLFLTAPLSKESGGTAKCRQPVYADRSDADYQTVRQLVAAAVRQAWERPRRDVAGLPRPAALSARW